ncbi:MAG: type II toxin-antitoxin system RelE/ParE family toxin [Candidatus Amesbacteria bacterium]|nr:type II toxin-antitoxin system RelE/ParE family toxin [Candidatus Amesbacteria bacterium]
MSKSIVYYYTSPSGNNPVKEFIDSLIIGQRVKIRRIFELAENYGIESIRPYVKKLSGSPLWEIRVLGKDNIRVLYVGVSENNIIVLHGFFKNSLNTPIKEIDTALKRLAIWRNH